MAFVSPERIANTNERSAETPFDSMLDKPLSHPLLSTTGGAMADCRAVPTLLPSVFPAAPVFITTAGGTGTAAKPYQHSPAFDKLPRKPYPAREARDPGINRDSARATRLAIVNPDPSNLRLRSYIGQET